MDYGLVNEVFDTPEALLAAALQCATEIAAKPPIAIWGHQQVQEAVTAMKNKRAALP